MLRESLLYVCICLGGDVMLALHEVLLSKSRAGRSFRQTTKWVSLHVLKGPRKERKMISFI